MPCARGPKVAQDFTIAAGKDRVVFTQAASFSRTEGAHRTPRSLLALQRNRPHPLPHSRIPLEYDVQSHHFPRRHSFLGWMSQVIWLKPRQSSSPQKGGRFVRATLRRHSHGPGHWPIPAAQSPASVFPRNADRPAKPAATALQRSRPFQPRSSLPPPALP